MTTFALLLILGFPAAAVLLVRFLPAKAPVDTSGN